MSAESCKYELHLPSYLRYQDKFVCTECGKEWLPKEKKPGYAKRDTEYECRDPILDPEPPAPQENKHNFVRGGLGGFVCENCDQSFAFVAGKPCKPEPKTCECRKPKTCLNCGHCKCNHDPRCASLNADMIDPAPEPTRTEGFRQCKKLAKGYACQMRTGDFSETCTTCGTVWNPEGRDYYTKAEIDERMKALTEMIEGTLNGNHMESAHLLFRQRFLS